MKFKYSVTLFMLFILQMTLSAEQVSGSATRKDSRTAANFGIFYSPITRWYMKQAFSSGDSQESNLLHFTSSPEAFTTYEGSIWTDMGFNIGATASVDDNYVGKINRFVGFIGFESVSMRMASGRITGTAHWDGIAATGQATDIKVDTTYRSIALLWAPGGEEEELTIGIGYKSYTLPTQFKTTFHYKGSVKVGNSAYQDNIKYPSYSFLFNMDTMQKFMNRRDEGFHFWANMQTSFSYTKIKTPPELYDRILEVQTVPGLTVKRQSYIPGGGSDSDCYFGLMWIKNSGDSSLGIALGGNFDINVMVWNWNSQSKQDMVLNVETHTGIIRYGPVIRVLMTF